jgi:hypothetical protein
MPRSKENCSKPKTSYKNKQKSIKTARISPPSPIGTTLTATGLTLKLPNGSQTKILTLFKSCFKKTNSIKKLTKPLVLAAMSTIQINKNLKTNIPSINLKN